MAVSKLIPMSTPAVFRRLKNNSCSFPSATPTVTPPEEFRCYCKGMDIRPSMKKGGHYSHEKKPLEVKASILISPETKTENGGGVDLALLLAAFKSFLLHKFNLAIKRRRKWRFPLQAFLEKAIIDCRFFTLLAVAGSLIGSLLCFLDGSFLIVESYLQYFQVISHGSDQGHIIHLLIEAIDMFLVAIAMLVFGMGLHVSFVGSYPLTKVSQSPQSLYLKNVLSSWGGMRSIMASKSKIGQAVIMLLQVGVLEKFSSVPLVTGIDMACFAAALFLTSACVFLLSKLTISPSNNS